MGADRRTLVVIGASAGGVEALTRLASELAPDLPAAVAVVLHVPPGTSVLPLILNRRGALPCSAAADGEALEPGRIYVAPPDRHMVVDGTRLLLTHGPKENGHRPAVDPLFSSAAAALGPAVVGVILSGTLDDGAAGLGEIKRRGGVAVVQDPADALHAGMPNSAIARVDVDHVVPIAQMARLIGELVSAPTPSSGEPRPPVPAAPDPPSGALDAGPNMHEGDAVGLSCPECGGTLWSVREGGVERLRCRIGHAYSEDALLEEQGKSLEIAMWTALRALEERTALLRRMAHRARSAGHIGTSRRFEEHARILDRRAAVVRDHVAPPAVESDAGLAAGA